MAAHHVATFANHLAVGLPDLLFIVAKDKGDVDPRSQDLHAMAGSIVAGDFAASGVFIFRRLA